MSIVGHFSVFDRKAQEYAPVFTGRNADVARRMVVMSLTDDNLLCKYPKDYTLCHLCDFDNETGDIIKFDSVVVVAELHDLIPDELKHIALDGSFNDSPF